MRHDGGTAGRRRGEHGRAAQLVWGVGLMTLGLFMTLGNLDLVDLAGYRHYWPLFLVALGLAKFLSPREDGERGGLWLVGLGLLLQLHTLDILRFHDSWPLFLVVLGLKMVLSQRRHRARTEDPAEAPHGQ